MGKTTKILVTIGVVFLFFIVFGAIAGAMGDAGRTPGILGLILFGILICVLRAIWTKSKNEEDNLNHIDTKQKKELQPVKKPIDGKYKSLYAELTSKCYPQNFMEPYDHQKVKIANEIYAEILKSAEDLTKLKELRIRAIKELNIQFSTEELYKKLLDLTNPQRFIEFMREYDAEKVSLANDFYQRVKDNANDILELEAIQDEINQSSLIPDRIKEHTQKIDDATNGKKGLIISLLCIGFVVIVIIAFHADKIHSAKDNNIAADTTIDVMIDSGYDFSIDNTTSELSNREVLNGNNSVGTGKVLTREEFDRIGAEKGWIGSAKGVRQVLAKNAQVANRPLSPQQTSTREKNYLNRSNTKAQTTKLDKIYSNAFFSINYPSSWMIVQDDNQITTNTTISVQIMEKKITDVDFRPNINIIVSSRKWKESTSDLASQSSKNNKQQIPQYKKLGIGETHISNNKGSLLEYTCIIQGYKLHGNQYIIKKSDNTTFIITATTDESKHREQMKIVDAILKSSHII